ncbi:hypothetical protein, partial [Actinomadura bangladeshensis]
MKSPSTDEQVRSMARVRDESLAGFADRPAARDLREDIVRTDTATGTGAGAGAPVRVAKPARFRLGVRLGAVGV